MISFFVALAFMKKEKPEYFKYIFIFIVLGLLISLNSIIIKNYTWYFNSFIRIFIQQLLLLFQSLILGLFFIEILKKSNLIKKIKLFLLISILTQLTLLFIVFSTKTEIKSNIASNLFLLICCLLYLRELMYNKPTLILVKSSVFWIVIGIFYSSCISLPINSLIPFIKKSNEYSNLRGQIFSITNMSVIILYLFIIKSYLCLKHPQNL